jgi:predicted nucleic acid-binding protein
MKTSARENGRSSPWPLEINAGFVLMDENLGRRTAVRLGVAVKGTLGVLEDGAARSLVDLPEAIRRLRATNNFLADEVVDGVLKRHEHRDQDPGRSR